jgi:hypothetical protein
LLDSNGEDIDHVEEVELVLFLTADRLAYVVQVALLVLQSVLMAHYQQS